jgi:hypothetical protein
MTHNPIKFDIIRTRHLSKILTLNGRLVLADEVMKKKITVLDSENIVPVGYSKQELEEIACWLNDCSGDDSWTFTDGVICIKDPMVHTMFALRWS